MLPDRVSNPGPLTYESGALPIALRSPARNLVTCEVYIALHSEFVRNLCTEKGITLHVIFLHFFCLMHELLIIK